MSFERGTKRLAVLVGLCGAVIGANYSYRELSHVPAERYQHKVFERLAGTDVVKREQKEAHAMTLPRGLYLIRSDLTVAPDGSDATSSSKGVDYDQLAKKYGGAPVSSSGLVAEPLVALGDRHQIAQIFWKKDLSVDFFRMDDGGIVSSQPSPSAWIYLLGIVYPAIGFLIPWLIVTGIVWAIAGFRA